MCQKTLKQRYVFKDKKYFCNGIPFRLEHSLVVRSGLSKICSN